jgi:MoaA/NifB/PqqE/SkfB family radical SAM enzyme
MPTNCGTRGQHGRAGCRGTDRGVAAAGIDADEVDVDVVISTTITGIAVPSIEARIAQIVGLRPDVKRMPLFGLGRVAGAARRQPSLAHRIVPLAARMPRVFDAAVQQLAH